MSGVPPKDEHHHCDLPPWIRTYASIISDLGDDGYERGEAGGEHSTGCYMCYEPFPARLWKVALRVRPGDPRTTLLRSGWSFNYNADNELATENYDANGNVLTTSGKTFAYDSENRLKSMNDGTVTIVYDDDGNRVVKTASGVTTRYLVDDLNPTGYPQVVEELVGSAVQREYTTPHIRGSSCSVME